jgi:hypothetical protein
MGSNTSKAYKPPPYESVIKQLPPPGNNNSNRTGSVGEKGMYDKSTPNGNSNIFTEIINQELEEKPLTPTGVIKLKDGYDEARHAAYIKAYKTGCSNYVKHINNKLKNSYSEVYIEIIIDVSERECKPLTIPREYTNTIYNKQLIYKVCNYIQIAYKEFGVTMLKDLEHMVVLRIKMPQTVKPFS